MLSPCPDVPEHLLVALLPRLSVAGVDVLHLRQVCAVCRLERRRLGQARATKQERVAADDRQGHPAAHDPAHLAVAAIQFVGQEGGCAPLESAGLLRCHSVHRVDERHEGTPSLKARLEVLRLLLPRRPLQDLLRVRRRLVRRGVRVHHLDVQDAGLRTLPKSVRAQVASCAVARRASRASLPCLLSRPHASAKEDFGFALDARGGQSMGADGRSFVADVVVAGADKAALLAVERVLN